MKSKYGHGYFHVANILGGDSALDPGASAWMGQKLCDLVDI